MTQAFVLFAHPCEESFGAALHNAVLETTTNRGWAVDDCDLYAEGFNPVLSAEERRTYHDTDKNTLPVASYVERLCRADTLIMVHPVWNFGYPAILKGFLDRVFLPGVSFHLKEGQVIPALDNIRRFVVITTYGATRFKAFLAGDPPRRIATRMLRATFRPQKLKYLALYDMNNATQVQRENFLKETSRVLEVI